MPDEFDEEAREIVSRHGTLVFKEQVDSLVFDITDALRKARKDAVEEVAKIADYHAKSDLRFRIFAREIRALMGETTE